MAKADLIVEKIKNVVNNQAKIRNIAIAAHIDHGKTTLTDNLLAASGLISTETAGKQCFMDFDKQEQERGITIYSANVSMIHSFNNEDYLINLIDTPGHVDFGGDVTRAMRAVDGCVILVDAVDGVMPQTETVVRQALKERVKPTLFINKMDRLIKELDLTPEKIQERVTRIITDVNVLIQKATAEEFKNKWQVNVAEGSVAFGSAYRNWALSVAFMKKTGITFKDIIKYTKEDKEKELTKKANISEVLLDMVINHLPNPKVAQKYRIEKIWGGDTKTDVGKSLVASNPQGPFVGIITNTMQDPQAGIISTIRVFSGTIREGMEVRNESQERNERIQQLGIYAGPRRIPIESIVSGNIVAVSGLSGSSTGDTICALNIEKVELFESIQHLFEPVVTKAIEVKSIKDLPKLIDILKQRAKEDPTIRVDISEDTGETLVSGIGELHIEAKVERFIKYKGIGINVSKPIVIYKEGVMKESIEIEGKTPNKHNKFMIKVSPLDEKIINLLRSGELKQGKIRKQDLNEVAAHLREAGMEANKAKKIVAIHDNNIFLNLTKGIVQLNEVIELLIQSFKEVCSEGPLAHEPLMGVSIELMDAKLHEDAIHRGPAQVLPAVKTAIREAINNGGAILYEPKQILRIDAPIDYMGNIINEVQNRRGQILEMHEEGDMNSIEAKLPVAEMFGFEAGVKSATAGRGFQSLIDIVYEKVPRDIMDRIVKEIKTRKGMN
ncbi:MAG: elongation factor EF-2 [Candidatus Nanohalarchaeota archaeon]|nr:MAG: elongation factor EF-2 [Candidatus Nanohaloarchaeota archaeon]